jgi:hypothetical protein
MTGHHTQTMRAIIILHTGEGPERLLRSIECRSI